MKHISKKLICVFLVICLIVSLSVPAYATASTRRFSAWLLSMLMAANITLESTLAPYSDLLDYLSGPINPVVEYLYPATDWEQTILDKSSIVISDDVVTIDGVDYRNVWLSHDAAEKFRVNALDFATALNLTSEDEGTFAEGVGFVDGIPVYRVNGYLITQNYYLPIGSSQAGNATFNVTSADPAYCTLTFSTGSGASGNLYRNNNPVYWYANFGSVETIHNSGTSHFVAGSNKLNSGISNFPINNTPFDFDWVSGDITLDPLPEGYGLWTRIPENTIQNIHNDYPDLYPDTTVKTPVNFDFDLPDVSDKLRLLFDILDVLMDLLETDPEVVQPEIGPIDQEPIPPTPGDETIANTPWENLVQEFNRIIQAINSIPQAIAEIPSTIQNIGQDIIDAIENIGDTVGDIARKIETGVTDLFKDFIDGLTDIFAPFLISIKGSLGIWHYVVEWITAISACFTFFIGIFGDVNYALVVPIYACVAAAICLALYKKFGR